MDIDIDIATFEPNSDSCSSTANRRENNNSVELIVDSELSTNLLSFPRKRPLRYDDPFFQEGTFEYKAAWLRLEDTNAYIPNITSEEEEENDKNKTLSLASQVCYHDRCHGEQIFSSVVAYEHHYETNHRHICQSCRKSFPGEKWLDLHIHEVHDVLIKIRRERGEKTYQCFVEGCDRLCSTPVKRRRHLIDKHHYPKWFNFDLVLTGVIPFNERMRQLHKEQALWKSRAQPRQQQINDVQKSDHHQQQHRRKKDHNLNEKGIAGSMDIETHSLTVNGASRKPQSSSIELSLPSSSTPSKCGLTRVNIITTGLVPKTKAFRQYRSPQTNMAATVRQRDVVMHDQDMATDIIHTSAAKNIAAPVPITTAITMHGSEDKIDMEIDSLQKSMARLMIPRSVANKMRSSNQK